jgi:hypothetical protein
MPKNPFEMAENGSFTVYEYVQTAKDVVGVQRIVFAK